MSLARMFQHSEHQHLQKHFEKTRDLSISFMKELFSALASQKGNPLSLQDRVFIFAIAPKYNCQCLSISSFEC